MKQIIAGLLAVIMLLFSIGCSENTEPSETTASTVQSETSENETTEEIPAEKTSADIIRELYGNVDYEGRALRILGLSEGAHCYNQYSSTFVEIFASEYNGDITNDAIFERNMLAEDLLNITIEPVWVDSTTALNTVIKNNVTAGTDEFDFALQSLAALGSPLQAGQLANFYNFDTIDTSHEWWDKNVVEAFTLFGNKLYWLTGDYGICDDGAVEVTFFNKDILNDNGCEYPYNFVRDGTWTVEQFYQLAKVCERDVNGDSRMALGRDIVPHLEDHDKVKHWIYAFGEKSIDVDENGSLAVMTTTEKQINVVQRIYEYEVEKGMTYSTADDAALTKYFVNGFCAFYCCVLGYIQNFREMESDFGIVPMPKYDEQQERYNHYISNYWVTAVCCPINVVDRDFTGVCLETLSAFSTDTVHSALYDTLYASKLIRDAESKEMLEIVLDTKSYDWAVDFSWGGTFAEAYNNVFNKRTNNYVSDAQKQFTAQSKLISKIAELISENED